MKVFYRRHRALFLALVPAVYLAVQGLLFGLADVMKRYQSLDDLLWQCTSALAYTLFVLGPLCFVCTGIACAWQCVKKLRSREEVRGHAILLPIALATVVLSALYFKWYWY